LHESENDENVQLFSFCITGFDLVLCSRLGNVSRLTTVAPASCRLSRGRLALGAAGGDARRTAAETAALLGPDPRTFGVNISWRTPSKSPLEYS